MNTTGRTGLRLRQWSLGLLAMACAGLVPADNFVSAVYDPKTDELVVTLAYRGTNPDHAFTLQWGSCRQADDGSNELDADVLDSQADDAAHDPYKTTTRFSLDDIPCRPATLTLRTAPRFIYTVKIPDAPAARP
jgi:hypothetical protein